MEKASNGTEKMRVAFENYKETLGKDAASLTRRWTDFWTEWFTRQADIEKANQKWRAGVEEYGKQAGLTHHQMEVLYNDYVNLGNADPNVQAIVTTTDMKNALIDLNLVWDGTIMAYRDVTQAELDAAEAAEEVLEAQAKVYQGMLSMTASFTSSEEKFTETSEKLAEERAKILAEKEQRIRQGYSETGSVIRDLNQKLADNSQAARDNATEHELATHRVILGYIEQQMQLDGPLSEAETNFLLSKGVEWGIYSATAIDEMRAVNEEWNNEQWRDQTANLNIVRTYSDTGAQNVIAAGKSSSGGYYYQGHWINTSGKAMGGSTIASTMYEVAEGGKPELYSEGSKTYLLTGSQGGMVTPAKNSPQPQGNVGLTSKDYKEFGRAMIVAGQQAGIW
jgi:hypothetical protein